MYAKKIEILKENKFMIYILCIFKKMSQKKLKFKNVNDYGLKKYFYIKATFLENIYKSLEIKQNSERKKE